MKVLYQTIIKENWCVMLSTSIPLAKILNFSLQSNKNGRKKNKCKRNNKRLGKILSSPKRLLIMATRSFLYESNASVL